MEAVKHTPRGALLGFPVRQVIKTDESKIPALKVEEDEEDEKKEEKMEVEEEEEEDDEEEDEGDAKQKGGIVLHSSIMCEILSETTAKQGAHSSYISYNSYIFFVGLL